MPSPTSDAFRAVLGRFATGVAVMTTLVDGEPHGMTVNAVSSVSLDPPLVLVCVERETVMSAAVLASEVFALSFLTDGQAAVSQAFADRDRPMGQAMFAGLATSVASTGSLVLPDSLGYVDCRLWAAYDGGDHHVVLGEVVDLDTGVDADGLLFFRSGYRAVCEPLPTPPS